MEFFFLVKCEICHAIDDHFQLRKVGFFQAHFPYDISKNFRHQRPDFFRDIVL